MARRNAGPGVSFFAFQDIITSVMAIMLLVTLILTLELLEQVEGSPAARADWTLDQLATREAAVAAELERLAGSPSPAVEWTELALLDPETIESQRQTLIDAIADRRETLASISRRAESAAAARASVQAATALIEQATPATEPLDALTAKDADLDRRLAEVDQGKRLYFRPAPGVRGQVWLVEYARSEIRVGRLGVSEPPTRFDDPQEFLGWVEAELVKPASLQLLAKPEGIDLFDQTVASLQTAKGVTVAKSVIQSDAIVLDDAIGTGEQPDDAP